MPETLEEAKLALASIAAAWANLYAAAADDSCFWCCGGGDQAANDLRDREEEILARWPEAKVD